MSLGLSTTVEEETITSLRNSEQRFRTLADNVAQLAWMADSTGAIFWYNHRWFEYTGTNLDEMLGWGWQKIHHPEYVDTVTNKFVEHVQSGEPWEDTFPLRGVDGNFRWFLSRAFPTHDAQGNVEFWCGTNTDITEQRDAEQALLESEVAVMERERRVRALYEITARTDIDFPEKRDRLLRSGHRWLGLDSGTLARIDRDGGTYSVVQSEAEGDSLPAGFTCPLNQTFCAETVQHGPNTSPLAIEHVGEDSQWREHAAYKTFGCEAYLGTVVRVNDIAWGTLAFAAPTPHSLPFTDFDKDIVRLIAQWIGSQLARQEAEEARRTTAIQQRRFVREMLASVTEGKLCLCDDPLDLPEPLAPAAEPVDLTPATLRQIRKRAEAVASELHLSKDRTQDLLTAVGEAAMNAVKYGVGGVGRVCVCPKRGLIQVWIEDHGTGIREEDLHRATLEKGWSGAGSLGHGFFLMLRTVDRTYLLTGAQGTTVVLEQETVAPEPAWAQIGSN